MYEMKRSKWKIWSMINPSMWIYLWQHKRSNQEKRTLCDWCVLGENLSAFCRKIAFRTFPCWKPSATFFVCLVLSIIDSTTFDDLTEYSPLMKLIQKSIHSKIPPVFHALLRYLYRFLVKNSWSRKHTVCIPVHQRNWNDH